MPQREDKQRGVRLADIRLPRYWPVSVIGALLLARRQQNRERQNFAELGKDLGEATTQRWQESDARADRLIALSKTLTRLTWVLLLATVVTLLVNVVILVSR
jgi:hypothetical protein